MKIGFIIDNVYQLGGVERVASLLCGLFSEKLNHEVTLFSCFSRPDEGSLVFPYSDKIRIVHLSRTLAQDSWLVKNSFSQKTFLKYRILSELKKDLKKFPQDILISTVCWCNCFVPFFKGKARNIACEHGNFMAIPRPYRWASRIFFRFSDAVVLLTEGNAADYTFVRPEKKFVIPNPLSFGSAQTSSCSSKRIISLSRFTHEKGNDMLLEIASKLKTMIPDWRIDLFAAGPDEAMLKARVGELDLNDFLYFNAPTARPQQELLDSSLYILYSRSEGLPMVLLEAQACGLPIVAFDCDHGPRDIITEAENGFLIQPNDTEAFAQAVSKLASSEAMRRKFGYSASRSSSRFAPEKIAKIWQKLFDSLV